MAKIWLQRDATKWDYYAYCLQGRFCFRDQHAVYDSNDGIQGVGTGQSSILEWYFWISSSR